MNGSKRKGGSLLMTFLVLATVLCCFQNCSPAGIQFSGESVLTSKGNGDIYGGKTYVLTLDEGQCLDGTKLDSVISEQDEKYLLLRDQCRDLNPAVEISDENIQLLPEGLVYQDRLYIQQGPPAEESCRMYRDGRVECRESVPQSISGSLLGCTGRDNTSLRIKFELKIETPQYQVPTVSRLEILNNDGSLFYNYDKTSNLIQYGSGPSYLAYHTRDYDNIRVQHEFKVVIDGSQGDLKANLVMTGLGPITSYHEFQMICQTEGDFFSRLVQPTNQPQEPKRLSQ